MRGLVLAFCLLLAGVSSAWAVPTQTPLDSTHILRGRFTQQLQSSLDKEPVTRSGRFAAIPAHGLLWMMENPIATTTIITSQSAVQNVGGLLIKLPAKNLARLYSLVNAALAAKWDVLEPDFTLTPGGDAKHWQMLLTARHSEGGKSSDHLPYVTVTVSGKNFVEDIVMAKADGRVDAFHFSDESLSPETLSGDESRLFQMVER